MNKKVLAIIFFIAVSAIVNAENTPKDVVTSFGKALSAWCQSGDISYRIELERLCNGVKKCRVEDKIHADYQRKYGFVDDDKTFVLDSYLNMFQTLMSEGIRFNMSNITVETQDHYPDGQVLTFITADIRVSGKLNHTVKDLFLVRDDKISGIYSYSSQLGFKHLNGSLIKVLQKEKFRWTSGFRNGFAVVSNGMKKEGVIDTKGNIIVPCMWDGFDYLGGNFAWGFNVDGKGSCSYDLRRGGKRVPFHRAQDYIVGRNEGVTTFSEGYAVVYTANGKYGYLKESDLNYSDIDYVYDKAGRFHEGYAFVKLKGKGAIINKQFKVVVQDNDKYIICSRFNEGLACVQSRVNKKYGFIDVKGRIVIPCIFDDAGSFSEGLCKVSKKDNPSRNPYYQTSSIGFIDRQGTLVIPYSYDFCLSDFENGYAEVTREGEGTLLGVNGRPLPGFSWFENVRGFCDGLARFEKNGRFGFLNKKGEVIIPPIYETALFFSNGYACVGREINGKTKYGYINTDGVMVIPCVYDEVSFHFEDGIALVKKDGKVGLIDVFGNSTFLVGE